MVVDLREAVPDVTPISVILSFLSSLRGLSLKIYFPSTGTFRQRIPEHMVQVSCPDVHRAGYTFFLFFPPQQIGILLSLRLGIPELIESQVRFSWEGLELQVVGLRKISSVHP
ncbi:hypothetical protein MA16_Dca014414 [Dendrobium catenatum]|uniref:Uncharacterized protein n=1 Tax=Dendrobium catenatum TaxID=906689 RepID=A0A2I0WWK5_9ASPA|nr:hypothetical protein MA16_Dca014414 [Dendrobium catenatum]